MKNNDFTKTEVTPSHLHLLESINSSEVHADKLHTR